MGKDAARAPEHPPHVWEAQRRRFTQLYKGEKRKLVEVQRIMQDEHGFYATERQYKRKIKQWNLEKHAKAVEKSHALVTLKEMDAKLDLGCVYKLNGKNIAAHKLRRFARSHGLEAPRIVRKNMSNKRRATESRSRDITTSLAFLLDNAPGSKEVRFVDLHELFASVICFLWFESTESITSLSRPLSAESVPTSGFREWTRIVLKTTQLPPNDVILAMLYIHRLKQVNPNVIGKPGSEYRLATVALMLANKFLDDSTYTNKTWADVTGISVGEVHIMEVEFLSNMRYSLMASSLQWDSWNKQLGKLQEFLHQTPAEPARIHESPDVPRSEQQRDPPRIVELPDVPRNNRHMRTCPIIELLDGSDDDQRAALPGSTEPAADTIQHTEIPYVQPSSHQSDLDIEMSASNEPQPLGTKLGAGLATRDPMGRRSELLHPVEIAALHAERQTTRDLLPSPSTSPKAFQLASLDLDHDILPMPDDTQDMDGIITAPNTEALDYIDDPLSKFLASSPPFPLTLTMELPPPLPNLDDALLLLWTAQGSDELQEGPIPDLDDYLDLSLWEEGWSSNGLAWESVSLVEAPGASRVSAERGAEHDGGDLLRVTDADACDEGGSMEVDGKEGIRSD